MYCKYLIHFDNSTVQYCNLYDEENRQEHPFCNCENCKDFEPEESKKENN